MYINETRHPCQSQSGGRGHFFYMQTCCVWFAVSTNAQRVTSNYMPMPPIAGSVPFIPHPHVAAAGLYTKTGQKTKDRVRAPPLGHCARTQSWPPTHQINLE